MTDKQKDDNLDIRSLLQPGTIIPSDKYPNGRTIILKDNPLPQEPIFKGEEIRKDWEYVTAARPIELHERIYEIPTERVVQTVVPKVQVREIVKQVPKEEIEYIDKRIPLEHEHVIDKYVEVPVAEGTETKYVPKVEVLERTIEVKKPTNKIIEKPVDVPRIKEVVRYVESDTNVEQVIRYIPKKEGVEPDEYLKYFQEGNDANLEIMQRRARQNIKSNRMDRVDQLLIPKITKTVEVNKEIPVNVVVPLPFVVPKPMEVPVEVPVIRFRDHFIPVPVRRRVIPRIIFTDEVFEVQCVKEKPVLVVEDEFKPVPVNVKIHLKEKDIQISPMDPAELPQSDLHAMWMRVNADLLSQAREDGRDIKLYEENKDSNIKTDLNDVDLGPVPLHPGHPLMMTYLQNQWAQVPTTLTHNLYTPEFFRLHAGTLDSILNPQPHQVNITAEQAAAIGPLPEEIIPSPFSDIDTFKNHQQLLKQKNYQQQQNSTYKFHVPLTEQIPQPKIYN